MSGKKLNVTQKQLLRQASRSYPEQYFVELPSSVRGKRWLALNNRYRERCLKTYEADVKKSPSKVNDVAVAGYVSASAPAHVIDGWSFLGRAVDAALRGDTSSAVFFGYYAELRAAMAILAAEGLGIFNRRGPVLLSTGKTSDFQSKFGTHDISWLALTHWASMKRATVLMSGFISPRGIPLQGWFDKLVAHVPVSAVSDKWLGLWGIDLRTVGDDHLLRNGSSYRPSQFRREQQVDPAEGLETIRDLWKLLEPSRGVRFPNLVKVLLRRALHIANAGVIASGDLAFTGMGGFEAAEWAGFLSAPEDSRPILAASNSSKLGSDACHIEVICRAALLLSVATEASRRLLAAGEWTESELKFWWANQGVQRGLWPSHSVPDDPFDMWGDVSVALEDSEAWSDAAAPNASLWEYRNGAASSIAVLGGFEAVGIWGLVP